jgi:hypothetical protein
MPNSRILLSIIAFLSAVMVIWMLVSLGALEPLNIETLSPPKLAYFVSVFLIYAYFWVYFFRRPRGSKTVIDGRTALSVSAFIVGGISGYALIELEIIVPQNTSRLLPWSFAAFVSCTLLPILVWGAIYVKTLRDKKAALRRFRNS